MDAVLDALSSPDVPHQIFYHVPSTLPSYLVHTLLITPPAILLLSLTDFTYAIFALSCIGLLFLSCRIGGFKLPDLPMLAPFAYAASVSQSMPRILPVLQSAAADYVRSILSPDLDLELDDPVDHP
eukprot:g14232.t1